MLFSFLFYLLILEKSFLMIHFNKQKLQKTHLNFNIKYSKIYTFFILEIMP